MRRPLALVTTALLALSASLTSCGGSALDDVVRAISRSQGVEESTVRTLLSREATSTDDQLRVARQWEQSLPDRPLPNLETTLDDLADLGREQLRSATCQAIVDALEGKGLPDGRTFVQTYLSGLATGSLPQAEVQELVDTFDELWQDAEAGTLTATDVRLELLQLRYC